MRVHNIQGVADAGRGAQWPWPHDAVQRGRKPVRFQRASSLPRRCQPKLL